MHQSMACSSLTGWLGEAHSEPCICTSLISLRTSSGLVRGPLIRARPVYAPAQQLVWII